MAEQILCSVAESLVNRLASAAFREFGRINSVEDELKRLENTVDSIRDALFRAEEKQEQNWIKKLKDVLIPAEDLLDEFHIQYMIHKRDEPHRNKVTKVLHFFSPKKFALRRNTARGIEKIQNMFADMVRDMSALNLNSKVVVVGETNNEWRETKWNDDGDILGFKMHDLMHDLAKRVAGDDCCYLDNNAKGYQGRAVHVSVEFDALDLLKSLNPSRLRTLIVFSSDAFIASDASNVMDGEKESLISTFKYLRVLKFCDIGQHVSIEKLNHLRFLKSSLELKIYWKQH
ncbi:hypothetical protein P8452_68445 [Trifolium repens]|nr:hypothetical protein P8452_68445 [Trifolium repens]